MGLPGLILAFIVGLALGALGGFLFRHAQALRETRAGQSKADMILEAAKQQGRETELRSRDEALKIRSEAEAESSKRDQTLSKRQSTMDRRANEVEQLHAQTLAELQRVSSMSKEEAKQLLLAEVEQEARADMVRIIRQIEEEARSEGERRARELIADAIQRVASDHVAEVTVSVVPLPSDEMKGRIIGRNGRNIRTFEQAAGVDVIVDDTPEAVTISCFDSVRREVARQAMDRLVLDGRIHPSHIEKVVEQVRAEVERMIVEEGEKAAFDAGVPGLHPEIMKKLGRRKSRTSYGQNQLAHAVETAQLAGVIAAELGANVEIAKAGALLHDLGKAMDHNVEGTHALIGADMSRRYGVQPDVVNIIASHHHEVKQETVEAVIVEAADAISGARPGARRESLEQYIKRVKALEEIANSFTGVSQSYALQE